MMPSYMSAAQQAFAANCTLALVEGGRSFTFGQHFLPPQLITRCMACTTRQRTQCAAQAVTRTPTAAVSRTVASVHDRLMTSALRPGMQRAGALTTDCCGDTHKPPPTLLVAMQVRTFWADQRERAESYQCPPAQASDAQKRMAAADEIHALFVPPVAVRGLVDAMVGSPTLETMVDAAVAAGRRELPSSFPADDVRKRLSLFVASDAPALREAAVLYAQRKHGIRAAHSGGRVQHNNLRRNHTSVDSDDASAAASITAMADLVLLSQADVLLAFAAGSSFHGAATTMAPCFQRVYKLPTSYLMLQPLAHALLRFHRNNSFASRASAGVAPLDCLRDCMGVDPSAPRQANMSRTPLLAEMGGGSAVVEQMSVECRHACTCWLISALGGGATAMATAFTQSTGS